MAKTLHKPIFTEDLNKYASFLEASDVNLEATITAMRKETQVHQQIRDIVKKYQEEKTVASEDFEALAKTSCPDFVTLNAFEKINDYAGNVESILRDSEAEESVFDCSGITCETCWKNYINHMARLLNQSYVDIKMYGPEDDDAN